MNFEELEMKIDTINSIEELEKLFDVVNSNSISEREKAKLFTKLVKKELKLKQQKFGIYNGQEWITERINNIFESNLIKLHERLVSLLNETKGVEILEDNEESIHIIVYSKNDAYEYTTKYINTSSGVSAKLVRVNYQI